MTRHHAAQGQSLRIRHIATACAIIVIGLFAGHLATHAMAETVHSKLHPCGAEGCK